MAPEILNLTHYQPTAFVYPPLIAGILTLILGAAVLIRERSSLVSFWFWGLTTVGAGWLLCYVGMYAAPDSPTALSWIKAQHLAVVFIPTLVYIFTLSIVRRFKEFWAYAYLAFVASSIFASALPWGNWLVAGVRQYPWGYYAQYGPLSFPFLIFFFCMMGVSLRLFWLEYQKTDSQEHHNRLKAFLVAFTIAYGSSVDFLAAYGIPVYPFGYLPMLGFVGLSAHTIWRYHLTDFTPAFVADQVLKTMAEALLVLDREGTIQLTNQAACRLLGRTEAELMGRPLWTIGGDFLPKEKLQRALRSGVVQHHEAVFEEASGRAVVLDISIVAAHNPEGKPSGIVCIARDITHRSEGIPTPQAKAE